MELIDLKTFTDERGNLTVIEKLPFDIKRVFYIYGVDDSVRGGHRHKKTRQAVVCLRGGCRIRGAKMNLGQPRPDFALRYPSECLIIEPEDYHEMYNFSGGCILMVLASTEFDENDYIYPACANTECICYREWGHQNNCAWIFVPADGNVKLKDRTCPDYIGDL